MATHGLVASWETLELSVTASATHTRNTSDWVTEHSGRIDSFTCPDNLHKDPDISLSVEAGKAGALVIGSVDYATYTLEIASLGISQSTTAGFTSAPSSSVQIDDVKLYVKQTGTRWRLDYGEIRWYVNGVLQWSTPGGSFVLGPENNLTPGAIPLLGVAPTIQGSAAANPALALGVPAAGTSVQDKSISIDGTVTGGWRFKQGGTWYALPVNLSVLAVPTVSCQVSATMPSLSAADTNSASVSIYYAQSVVTTFATYSGTGSPPVVWDVYQTVATRESRDGAIGLWPDLDKSIVRVNNDYRALWLRGGFPWLKRTAYSTCFDWEANATLGEQTTTETVLDELTSYLELIDTGTGVIEDAFQATKAPHAAGAFKFQGRSYHIDTHPGVGDPPNPTVYEDAYSNTKNSSFPTVQARTGTGGNAYILPYLDHDDGEARYWNTWANAHWSFAPYFPANTYYDSGSETWKQLLWPVFGVGVECEYWTDVRSQWLSHPSLPVSPASRNHFVMDPLRDGALQSYTSSVFGIPSGFLGLTRFWVEEASPLSNWPLTSDSSPQWTFTDCAGTFGAASISIQPDPGKTAIVASYDIGTWTNEPYQYAHLFDQLTVGWDATANIDSARVYVVGQNGEKALLTEKVGTYARPFGLDAKYAGSWAQDFGAGYVTDIGSDSKASGISVATLGDAERCQAFSLLYGWDAKQIRFEFDLNTDTDPVKLTYPTFTAPEIQGTTVQESGQFAAVLYPSSGVRWGQRYWWDGVSLQTTPLPGATAAYHPTLLDWLCEKRVLLYGQERSYGLTTEIATLLDSVEGQTVQDADDNTFSALIFPAPGQDNTVYARAVLSNTLREVPPLCAFPVRERNRTTLQLVASNDWEQASFSYAQDYTRIASAKIAAHLKDGTDQWTTPSASISVANWAVSEHRHEVDNNESTFDVVRADGVGGTWAAARPWHGYFAVLNDGTTPGTSTASPHNLHTPTGQYLAVHIHDGDVRFQRADFSTPVFGWAVDTTATDTGDCENPRLAYCRRDGRIWLLYARTGMNAYYRTSDDEGATWSNETMAITSGTECASCSTPDGAVILASLVGTAINAKGKGPGDTSLSAEFTFKDSAGADLALTADTAFGLSYEPAGTAGIVLHCLIDGEAETSHWICTDWGGPTWAMSFKRIG